MSVNITTVITNTLAVAAQDIDSDQNYIDNSQITNRLVLTTGTGLDAINVSYIETWNFIGSSGGSIELDLFDLYRSFFNYDATIDFSGGKIMALTFENSTTGHEYPLTYSATGLQDFSSPYLISPEYKIYPDTVFSIAKQEGWNVDQNNRYLRFKTNAPSGQSQIQIGIVGRI